MNISALLTLIVFLKRTCEPCSFSVLSERALPVQPLIMRLCTNVCATLTVQEASSAVGSATASLFGGDSVFVSIICSNFRDLRTGLAKKVRGRERRERGGSRRGELGRENGSFLQQPKSNAAQDNFWYLNRTRTQNNNLPSEESEAKPPHQVISTNSVMQQENSSSAKV